MNREELERRLLELEQKKKYGLVWEEKTENVVEQCKKELPVLKEVKGKEIRDKTEGKPTNILIEGDNYHALSVLNYTHQGKIDVIYIDPPYNTGNKDFLFNDNYVDLEDTYRHSKWLSFMSKRLELSYNLLKSDGVIFMSIGEEEVSNLKLLSDDIFGEQNFINYVARIAKTASNKGSHFAPSIDFVLAYTKDINSLSLFKDEVDVDLYKKKDKRGIYRDDVALYQSGLVGDRPNCRYFILCPSGSKVIPPKGKFWRWGQETLEKNRDLLVFKETKNSPLLDQNGKQAKWNIYTKSYLSDRQETGTVPRNFLDQFINRQGADFLKTIDINFDYSKPVELIKHLIRITNKQKDIFVLDFTAGSGTTGQAVLEMNNEDDGNRTFILTTNNELNGVGSELAVKNKKVNSEEFGLCRRVTYPRLYRVMKGYKEFKPLDGKLRYFKTDFVPKSLSGDELKLRITNECTEMLCVREGIFEEVVNKKSYKIFEENGKIMAVYYSPNRNDLSKLKKELDKMMGEKILYCFTLDPNGLENADFDEWDNVRLEPIPQKILDVYKEINEY